MCVVFNFDWSKIPGQPLPTPALTNLSVIVHLDSLQRLTPELQRIVCVQQRSSAGRRTPGWPHPVGLRRSRQEVQDGLQPHTYASHFLPAEQGKCNLRPRGSSGRLPADQPQSSEHQTAGPPESSLSRVVAASQRPLPRRCRIRQPDRSHGQRPRPSRLAQHRDSAGAELSVHSKQRYTHAPLVTTFNVHRA